MEGRFPLFDQWDDLLLTGAFASREALLRGLTLESWPLAQHFPEQPRPSSLQVWEELVAAYLDTARQLVARSQDPGWLASPDPGYEAYGFTWRDALEFLAVHSAYHFGRVVLVRQLVGTWPLR